MSVEIILNEDNLLSFGKLPIDNVFKHARVINRRAPIGHGDLAPSFERRQIRRGFPRRWGLLLAQVDYFFSSGALLAYFWNGRRLAL